MPAKKLWLRCQASLGQFEDEFAISGNDHSGETFSFFTHREFVQAEESPGEQQSVNAVLRVTELANEGELVLIRLPGQTLANGQTLTVRRSELENAPAWQEA